MKTYLFLFLALSAITTEDAQAFGKKPVQVPEPTPAPKPTPKPKPKPTPIPTPTPAPGLEATCPLPGTVQAVDLSMPVDQKFLDAMKKLKVTTVIRYYDHTNETIRGKTLLPAETDLLARNGFDVMVVFQHNNSSIKSFTAARGASDAKRSLVLADLNSQALGSAIYFGVDGSWSSAADLTKIKTYFDKAAPIIRGGGFKVGAYGSGNTCTELLKTGNIDFCWLANAKGWPGYSAFFASNKWTMAQGLPKICGGKEVDFDVVNASLRDLGQFRP